MMANNPFVSKLNSFILGKADQLGTIAELNASGFDFRTGLDILLENIIENRPLPPLIILTGNAGDGKSHIIFKIWLYLAKRQQIQSPGDRISLNTMSEHQLQEALNAFRASFASTQSEKIIKLENYFLVKDASAVEPDELQEILCLALDNLHLGGPKDKASSTIILSINEGILRAQLLQICQKHYKFEPIVKRLLKSLEQSKEFQPLKENTKDTSSVSTSMAVTEALVLNLNTRDIGEKLLENMLNELAQPQHFVLEESVCGQCPINRLCPIRFNVQILGNKDHPARRRLANLFDALNQIGQHITFREALSAIAQTITGNLSCSELQNAYAHLEMPIQLLLNLEETPDENIVLSSQREQSFLLRVLPYLFFNSIFIHSIRQKELWESSQKVPLVPIGVHLSEEHLLLSIGLLDPAGYATPTYDVSTTFSSNSIRTNNNSGTSIQIERGATESEEVLDLYRMTFNALRDAGQQSSYKGIPDPSWLRSLVIASKRYEFFTFPKAEVAHLHFPLRHYSNFQSLTELLKKKTLNQADNEKVKNARSRIIAALNQFQQPKTVGTVPNTHLELIQRDHFVLFSRLLASQFEFVAAVSEPNAYIEQTQIRLRFQHIKTKTFLDCDLLLYEILQRFVDGSLSISGLEPRITEIENFLTKLRSISLRGAVNEEYTLVGRDITFSISDGQITVQEISGS